MGKVYKRDICDGKEKCYDPFSGSFIHGNRSEVGGSWGAFVKKNTKVVSNSSVFRRQEQKPGKTLSLPKANEVVFSLHIGRTH